MSQNEDLSAGSSERQIAVVTSLLKLQQGEYVEQQGWEPNYIKVEDVQISRANIMGTVVSMGEEQQDRFICTIDDGTATMEVRSFESFKTHAKLGDFVLLIGRPRLYHETVYIVPEIIRKVENKKWLEYRHKMLGEETEDVEQRPKTVIDVIEEMDDGSGVLTEEVIEKLKESMDEDNVKERITKLLLVGEVFEIRPGRIKVLK